MAETVENIHEIVDQFAALETVADYSRCARNFRFLGREDSNDSEPSQRSGSSISSTGRARPSKSVGDAGGINKWVI
jgi:hypothetical protein